MNFHQIEEVTSMNSTQGVYSSKTKPLINTFYCISRSLYSQDLGKYVKFVRIVRLPIFCYSFDLRYKFHYHPFPPPGASRRMYMPLILPRKKHSKPTFYLKSLKFSRLTLSTKWYWKNKGNLVKLSQSHSPSTVGLCRCAERVWSWYFWARPADKKLLIYTNGPQDLFLASKWPYGARIGSK